MSVLLIIVDDDTTATVPGSVLNIIREYKHIQLSNRTFAIETSERVRSIFNKFMPLLSATAQLFIVTLVKPFAGPVLEQGSRWLYKHLPEE
jgi:hypothetical protein